MKTAIILGAGFSRNSGLPVQSQIPEMLVQTTINDSFELAVSKILKDFIENVFGYSGDSNFPNLDDIFTCIDISTNSGHHLGIKYSPIHLRAIRRMLIYRVFSILEKSYTYSKDIESLISSLTERCEQLSYIVLNWDTVLERYLLTSFPGVEINYWNNGKPLRETKNEFNSRSVDVLKLHGSCNWLYCDNCRALLHDFQNEIPIVKKAGFKKSDFEILGRFEKIENSQFFLKHAKCPICRNDISSHIATFSYRKSFRTNSFPNVWDKAEDVLANASKWIFIGYSLPDADYEFKHLLKISELKYKHINNKLNVDIVLLNSNSTVDKYYKFFGSRIGKVCNNGITEYLNFFT